MYSTHNVGKCVIAETFIRTFIKIYKYMTLISKNVYIDKLDYIVNKYINTYHGTIKVKPVDVKPNTYIESSQETNDKDPKFKIGDIIRISKYKNIFAKCHVLNWSEVVFVIKKVKNIVPWTHLVILKAKKLLEPFTKKLLKKSKEFRVEKVIKRKGDKLYFKWKGYNSSFNSWNDKKT